MCGINGAIALHNEAINPADQRSRIALMNRVITHRGPDANGIVSQDKMTLGFQRLSIIDLREAANQPMVSENGNIILVFNGEIYNYLEIKNTLKSRGYCFRTDSDTEVIIKSYLEYGDECVQHFNGMWSFALYDLEKDRLLCSRDRLGVKPFYYTIINNQLLFSSELKAIQCASGQTRANHAKVYEYLAYGYRINDGETFFENCSELLPGTNLVVEQNKLRFHKYWELKEDMYKQVHEQDYYTEYEQLFKNAVEIRYRSDVPVAILLSGGLDSSAIARVTNDLIEAGSLAQNEMPAFIASFPNYQYDETKLAREFIKTCPNIRLHEMQIDSSSVVDNFDDIIYSLDHPMGSFASVAHNNIMKACKQRGIKVVLNGQGSDEAFAGYDRYISGVYLLDQLLQNASKFSREFSALNKLNGYSKSFLITQMVKSILNQPFASFLRARYQERSIECLEADFVYQNRNHYKSEYNFSVKGNNFNPYLLNQINHQGLNTILHYEDISSMQQSIEIRSPFLDYRLMEFAFSIPTYLKFSMGITKVIQRKTIGRTLPDFITKNRKKIGFSTPFNQYISCDSRWKAYINQMLDSQSFKNRNIWHSSKIREKFKQPLKHPNFPFWRILNLEIWARNYGITNL